MSKKRELFTQLSSFRNCLLKLNLKVLRNKNADRIDSNAEKKKTEISREI